MRDPALLIWLDARENLRGHPNENLARELMELFTLGVGHYTEADVKEAARALTGWSARDGRFCEDAENHDPGEKTILGRTGRWRGDDLVRMLLEHPATSRRLAQRLCRFLMGENRPPEEAIEELAAGLRQRQLDIAWGVETVLRSRAFFAPQNLRSRVLGPAEYVVGLVRVLELFGPAPNVASLAECVAHLGQDLFHPPNAGGWPGGRAGLTTRAAIGRANFAAGLLAGRTVGLPEPVDVLRLAQRHARGDSLEEVIAFFSELIVGSTPDRPSHDRLIRAFQRPRDVDPESTRRLVTLICASPDAQLG